VEGEKQMNTTQTIIAMLAGHLITDYTLQGWLADGKQKSWWNKITNGNLPPKYRYDYIAALICHALYWSIAVCLPLWDSPILPWAIIGNTIIHAVVDDLKANRSKLNLIQDQLLHLAQIVITATVI
jgi:hypothetical protein